MGSNEQVETLIATLASKRLVATSGPGPEAPAENFVEVSHEALIREWPALREWLRNNREDLRLGRSLLHAAEEWRGLSRDRSALLHGIRLAQARKWFAEHRGDAPPVLGEFLEASFTAEEETVRREREARERENARQTELREQAEPGRRRRSNSGKRKENAAVQARRSAVRSRRFSYALGLLLLAAGSFAFYANAEKHNAQTALARSAVQDGIRHFDEGRPDQAAAYFVRALRSAPDSLAATSWLSDLLLNRIWWLPGAPLQHQGIVMSAAFSPEGRRVVTASWDKTARVWLLLLACCASQKEAERLASLAEAVSLNEVSDTGAVAWIDGRERLRRLGQSSGTGPAPELSLDWIIRRFAPTK